MARGVKGSGSAEEVVEGKVAKKRPDDPVKVRCDGTDDPSVKELSYSFNGTPYTIPVGGEMDGTMPRMAAELLLARAKRYWTQKVKLVIVEPNFK